MNIKKTRKLQFKYDGGEPFVSDATAVAYLLKKLLDLLETHNKDDNDIHLTTGAIHFDHDSEYDFHGMEVEVLYFAEFCKECNYFVDHFEYERHFNESE